MKGLLAALALCAALHPPAACAQYPSKPIHLIVGYATGGGVDAMARPLMVKMQPLLGQPIILDYRPGANATIGAQVTASAAPDGYTLHIIDTGPMVIVPHVLKVAYDPIASFTPIGLVCNGGIAVVAHPSFPANSLQDLIGLAKAQPGKISYGTSGIAGAGHMAAELLQLAAQMQITHVAYKGGGPAMTDLLGGHIPLLFASMGTAVSHIKSGKIKGLAVTSATRVPAIPQVQTVAELGFPGFEAVTWFGLVGPAKLPAEIVAKINQALNKALDDKGVQDAIRNIGYEPSPVSPALFAGLVRDDVEKWRKVVREANVRPE